nr:PREDICTED: Fanconi anemia core complex-associated protein 20 [Latimeria chalumnae]|eukprot:XP_005996648.1 PREDICTED: Fanconi anemia core complex-associated protein 20 [Latimeria chalumnae]
MHCFGKLTASRHSKTRGAQQNQKIRALTPSQFIFFFLQLCNVKKLIFSDWMAEEKAAKLKLKKKKNVRTELNRKETSCNVCVWFERTELQELETPWLLVLKSVYPDLKPTHLGTVPDFPAFPHETSEPKEQSTSKEQRSFSEGMEQWTWMSFPMICKPALKLNHPECNWIPKKESSHLQNLKNHEIENTTMKRTSDSSVKHSWASDSVPSSPYSVSSPIDSDIVDNRHLEVVNLGLGGTLDAAGKRNLKRIKHSELLTNSESHREEGGTAVDVAYEPLAPSHKYARAFGLEPATYVKSQGKRRQSNGNQSELPHSADDNSIPIVDSLDESTSATGQRDVSILKTDDADGKDSKKTEEAVTLENCPLCLMQFPGGLPQLEIDSHLAKCLAESAEDVMW